MNQEKLLTAITEQVPGLVVMYNINTGQYLYVNNAVKKILGYVPEDFLNGGLPFVASLVHPDDLSQIMEKNSQALAQANSRPAYSLDEDPIVSFEYRMKHKNGSWRWLHTEGSVFARDEGGQVESVLNISLDITERKEKERQVEALERGGEALKESEQAFRDLANSMPQIVWTARPNGYIDYCNKRWYEFTGFAPNRELPGSETIIHPEDIELARSHWQRSINTGLPYEIEYRFRDKVKGGYRWFLGRAVPVRSETGEIIKWFGTCTDINEQKLAQEALKESEQRFRSLIEAVEDYAIFRLDTDGNVASWNEGIEYIFGYSAKEILGKSTNIFFTETDQEAGIPLAELEQARAEGTTVREGIRVRKDGTNFYAVVTTTAIWDEQGLLQGFSKVIRDITELKEAEETIRFQALHDGLTGLPNRKALDEYFALSQSMAMRNQRKLAILFLDLDRFKNINDTLGHGIGDLILKEVAHRLQKSVRQIDTVARLGGDEFIILLNDINSTTSAARVAEKILQAMTQVLRVQNQSFHVTTSIGIAMFPADGQDIYTLLKNADTALYRAKDAGRNRYQFYNYSMNLQSAARLSLEQDLRNAIVRRQLRLAYQPFVNIKTGKILGVEALVRWEHPDLGLLFPYDFIPLAEETGMILPIGKWIIRSVCRQGKQLHDQGFPLQVTVNLSARQFAEAELVETIGSALKDTDFNSKALELEITESVAMENLARTSNKLNDLKRRGISIAIDDFGTGYSSLSYLKRFPVHKLKIDKSFVKHAIIDSQDSTIIRAIISMGHSLGLKVCAEGVEDEQQKALLKSMDCDLLQGYLVSKPLAPLELINWLRAQSGRVRLS